MSNLQANHIKFTAIRLQAELLAGPPGNLRRRAAAYLDLFQASNGVCRFALIAAHGALWAAWYLICARIAARVFSIVDVRNELSANTKYRQFSAYVDTLMEINTSVMVETYVLVHTIRDLGPSVAIENGFPADLVQKYDRLMLSSAPSEAELRDIYERHFRWEQDRVVSNKLDDAFAAFTWPMMRSLCQRPWVWFSYFRAGKSMNFKEFTNREERIEKGLIAFDNAVHFGVERLGRISATRLKIYPGFGASREAKFRQDLQERHKISI